MTKNEELIYLTNLVLEASSWRFPLDDQRDSIRYEVETRIQNLTGELFPEPDSPEPAPKNDPKYEKKLANMRKNTSKWRADKVRVHINGVQKWFRRDQVVKEPIGDGTRWHWVPKEN